ncbi:MAG: dihydrofolate reductase [Tannerellaceae bacterium]|nr:dihydrofolate reductase [Tannerellaceae bacterium]
MSTISIIVAIAENNAIGKNQDLLWHLPNDMKRFRHLTTGHPVIMGRKTFESLPKGALPNRKNIILTSVPEHGFVDCFACESMDDALDLCANQGEVFMIGGAMVYKQALEIADKMYITLVQHTFEDADTFFPEIRYAEWKEVEREDFPADEKHAYPYSFLTYERIR